WYSPVLKRQLDRVTGEAVAAPRDEAELRALLAAAYAMDVPVTPRGGGTGNYGQAMPLRGGIVLDMTRMDRLLRATPTVARAEAGIRMGELDSRLRREVGAELRVHPSTLRTATLGGFIAGGSGGVGGTTWGGLRAPGNILALRVVTMEAAPRVLELRGPEVQKANHAYGTTGVITEVELPLAPAWEWVDVVAAFPSLGAAARFADSFVRLDAVAKKLASVLPAPVPQRFFRGWGAEVPEGHAVACLMVAEPFLPELPPLIAAHGGAELRREPTASAAVPLYEHAWNHTTLQVLKADRGFTYLQCLLPAPDHLGLLARLERRFGEELLWHVELGRIGGSVAAIGLPLVRYSTEERLRAIMREIEAAGAPVFDPHSFLLEEGGMKRVDEAQLAFKRQADPKGLLNPGKMAAFEDPDWRPGAAPRFWLYETDEPPPPEVLE
ncbi:MAG: FAD-binding oxidoreductase, partial [Acetobacteraceae bacterium]|nr:FAD-binding oxidoreductase [Acetobacteraceae bacterium]